MTVALKGQTNRLLGYPEDARLLIINADDFGMCRSINKAVFRALGSEILRSTPELLAIEKDSNHIRKTDYDFLMSQEAQTVIQEEGIILLDYRTIQAVWNLQ